MVVGSQACPTAIVTHSLALYVILSLAQSVVLVAKRLLSSYWRTTLPTMPVFSPLSPLPCRRRACAYGVYALLSRQALECSLCISGWCEKGAPSHGPCCPVPLVEKEKLFPSAGS